MPFRLGTTELVILLVIVLLLFGVGRIGKIASEMGKGIREFRQSLSEEEKAEDKPKKQDS